MYTGAPMPPHFPVSLRWPSAPDATRYRVVVSNIAPGELLKLETDQPEVSVEGPTPAGDWPEWRVQVSGPDGAWADYLPYMEWPSEPAPGAIALAWPDDDASLHRVVVHDDSAGAVVIKAATLERSYTLDPGRLDPSHVYRWRVQRWDDGSWVDAGAYRSLPRNVAISQPGAATVDREPDAGAVVFLFTSDTEAHMRWMAEPDGRRGIQEHIFGSLEGEPERVGIGRQMDMLDEHGFKGTFFIDILAEFQFGEGSLQPVFDEVQRRGHDAQLHLHPSPHLRFASDERVRALSFATLRDDPAMFRGALEVAIELFERRAGRRPVAYRAGAYRIFDSHFPVLRDLGIVVDSSVNPFKNCNVAPWLSARTQPAWIDGVLEVPITWHLWHNGRRWRAEQFAPVTSPTVQRAAVAATPGAEEGPPTTVCYIAHSYSFLGRTTIRDEAAWAAWNQRWEELVGAEERAISGYNVGAPLIQLDHVDNRRIETFSEVLKELAGRPSVAGIPLAELAERRHEWPGAGAPFDPLPGYDGRGRRPTATATRRYSESYLASLESALST